ncbi:MAG: hypothetical protein AB7P52_04305 [Alphaproteobacteria bacterium]
MSTAPIAPVAFAQGVNPVTGGQGLLPLSAGMRLDGLVTGHDRDGNALVRTSHGMLALPPSPALTPGARTSFELVPLSSGLGAKLIAVVQPDANATSRPAGPPEALLPRTAPAPIPSPPNVGFPALAEALARLDAHAPRLALQALHALPGGDGSFVSALLSVVGALRRGDVFSLLGVQGTRSLDRPTLAALKREIDGAARAEVQDANGEAWRTLLVPVLDGEALGHLGIFLHRQPRQDEADGTPQPVRFLVEASPSTLGPLQIDGFSMERRLDLILRSHKPLPEAWRDDIRALYGETLATLGLSGGIVFQVVPHFPVSGMAALHATSHASLTA